MAWHGKELPLLRLAAHHRPAMMLPLYSAVPAAWDGGPRGFQSQSLHLEHPPQYVWSCLSVFVCSLKVVCPELVHQLASLAWYDQRCPGSRCPPVKAAQKGMSQMSDIRSHSYSVHVHYIRITLTCHFTYLHLLLVVACCGSLQAFNVRFVLLLSRSCE